MRLGHRRLTGGWEREIEFRMGGSELTPLLLLKLSAQIGILCVLVRTQLA